MMFSARLPRPLVACFIVTAVVYPKLSAAQSLEIESIRGVVKNLEQQLQKALQRIDQLEKERAAGAAKIDQVEKSVQASARARRSRT